jgi:glucokinase
LDFLRKGESTVKVIAGVDLGGTAINYTIIDAQEQFLIEGLCEHPALSTQGPDVCLAQIEKGWKSPPRKPVCVGRRGGRGARHAGSGERHGSSERARLDQFRACRLVGIRHPAEAGSAPRRPVTYLNDGNAGALWGHFSIFGADSRHTSITTVIGTGLGGGVIIEGNVVKGRMGFGGELGHVLIPYQSIAGTEGMKPECNCGRTGCLESVCSLTAIAQDAAALFPAALSGDMNWGKWRSARRPNWCAGWPKRAIRCAARSSACRRTGWGCSSTR